MGFLFIFMVGILRIFQANINKTTSSYMTGTQRYLRYGAYFEGAASLFSLVYLCVTGFYGFNIATVVCSALTGICFLTELMTALTAMRCAPLVLCNFCSLGGGIILPSIAGIFFFGEPMSVFQWLGVAIFFVAVYFLSSTEKTAKKKLDVKTCVMLILNFVVNGFCSILGKYFAVRVENGNAALYSALTYALASVFFLIAIMILPSAKQTKTADGYLLKKLYPYGLILGAVCATIVFSTTTLSRTVPVVILNTVPSAISIIGCLFVGRLLFSEKITVKNVFGVVFGVISATLIVTA